VEALEDRPLSHSKRFSATFPILALALFATLGEGKLARADDTLVPRPPRILPPARSLAGTDDVDAIALNPAQLAFIPSWELRYTHVQLPSASTALMPAAGDAVGLAFPLYFGLATGLRFESIRPPSSAPLPSLAAVSWSLAYRLADTMSAALDLRRWVSGDLEAIDGATSLSFALAWRPLQQVGLAIVARDVNGPRGHLPGDSGITPSFDFGLALRPLGTRTIELGLETKLWTKKLDQASLWSPRATLGIDIPSVGRLQGAFEVADPKDRFKDTWTTTFGLEVGYRGLRPSAGMMAGPGLGSTPGWYAGVSLAGFSQPGIKTPDRAVKIRIEDTPGARGHVRLLRKLARLGRDPSVKAVVLVAKSDPASSTAHAEELADAIAALQERGKRVVCHLEDAGGKSLLACSGADLILVQPGGGIRFAGFRSQSMYFGEALRKLGIEPEFIRIKEHKSAAEAFVRDGPTPVAEADTKEMLERIEGIYLDRLSKGRNLPRELVKANIAKGPFVADEAIAAGFVNAKAFDDEVTHHVQKLLGVALRVDDDEPELAAPKSFGKAARIAILYIDGDIVDGRSQKIPLLGTRLVGSYTIAEALEEARKDPTIAGVIVRIESPGGSSLASDVMWREAELLGRAKPTIVSMGSVAASGGYYTAAFGSPIYASRATVTGSIGIFYGKADVSGLLGKLGIHVHTQKTAPKADAESLYRPFTEEEKVELKQKVEQFYAVFLDRVARGRKMTVEQVDAVGRGKVWLGDDAKERGLVDVVGGLDAALTALRNKLSLPADTPIVELPEEKGGLLDVVLGLMGASAPPPSVGALPKAMATYADAMAPFVLWEPDQPLALWEGIGAL
jgi:protease-4